jgi:xanthine dehydrogenase molybdopterin-binding subunit B
MVTGDTSATPDPWMTGAGTSIAQGATALRRGRLPRRTSHQRERLAGHVFAGDRDGSGCYGRNGQEDVSADAELLVVLAGQPARVQWLREDDMARSPKSPPHSIDLEAGRDDAGNIVAFKPLDFPLLAAAETGIPRPGNWVGFLFQDSGFGCTRPKVRVNTRHVEKAFLRRAHLRCPGRIENTYATESFIDELA